MLTNFTKGDWMVSGEDQIVSMPSQCKIANRISGWNYEELKANARLIAAAPNLLEACQLALRTLASQNIYGKTYLTLETAIEKAIGSPEIKTETDENNN